ncbi:aspartate/glutamate racemase family protein [Saccharothrix sp. 6-C]|uniref:maleate cis-trans isomerase family protein n=1 Tax=Saccharothrix sp. 6-C TaxID=2781735 RepID=UPI001917059C|nr:aspartate/glutamate racemase family protein [Saccharothrix sp. 6-C]QQQ79478.1 aspartate/glutamate racemase family protein [Saccharothrix sp. 6-C]
MYGRRARLGVIVPSTNTTVEPEFAAHVPRDVAVLATRVPVAEVAAEQDKVASLLAMHDHVERAAAELAGAGVAAIAFACTSGSFLGGRDPDQVMCDELTRRHGLPVVTTSSALVAALAALAARRLAVATPYVTSVADGAQSYLVQAGFDVVSRHDLRILSNLDKGRLEPTESYLAARELDVTDADAVVISCTNWRTLDSLAAVEADTGRPAVSSNLATLWALLRLAGVEEPFSPGTALTRAGLPDAARAQWSARTAAGVVTGG